MAFVRIKCMDDWLQNGEFTESEHEIVINSSLIRYLLELHPRYSGRDLNRLRFSQKIIVVTRISFGDGDTIDMQGTVTEVCSLLGIETANYSKR